MLNIDQILQARYRITGVLRHDSSGAVYQADDQQQHVVCVVKEILPPADAVQAAMQAQQFLRESQILAGLHHPNLARVSGYFSENGNYYLVMDMIAGQSLEKLLGTGPMSEATVLPYADQLLDALVYMHSQGALHRDIKPAHIIVQPNGRALLVGFGLFTGAGATPNYAPPDLYTGGMDARSDLYSLAATMYHALSGQAPLSAAEQISGRQIIPLRQARPEISENTSNAIAKGLSLDRMKRYQNAAEMRTALKGAAPIPATPVSYASVTSQPAAATKKSSIPLWLKIAGIGGGIGIVVLGACILTSAFVINKLTPVATPTSIPTQAALRATATFMGEPTDVPLPTVKPTAQATATRKATATPAPTVQSNDLQLNLASGVSIQLVRIPAGEFLMGSTQGTKDAYDDEIPQSKLMLNEFLIGEYDVTNAQFAAFVNATGYKTLAEKTGVGATLVVTRMMDNKGADWLHPLGPDSNINGKANFPVVQVSWDDAVAFSVWASKVTGRNVALPSEAQWEKASRGTAGGIFPWGNGDANDKLLNYNNYLGKTTPVGGYSPAGDSPYGLADMAGNVWQWTTTRWGSDINKPADFKYPYDPNDGREDLTGTDARLVRGGSFIAPAVFVRSALRNWYPPTVRMGNLGFRVLVVP